MDRGAVELSRHTTIGLGGPAREWLEPSDVAELQELLRARRGTKVLVLGGGSNVVVADEGIDGAVLHLGARFSRSRWHDHGDALEVVAEAGASFDALVAASLARGAAGLEVLSGIPGSIGATPLQNVGAYGREIAEFVQWIEVIDRAGGAPLRVSAAECGFGYRHSRFRGKSEHVVTQVCLRLPKQTSSLPLRYAELSRALQLSPGQSAKSTQVREVVLGLRAAKGMLLAPEDSESRSCGSFFTNPIVENAHAHALAERLEREGLGTLPQYPAHAGCTKLPAAWLLERAGFVRGFGGEAIGVSRKHTLALVHRGGGSTAELLALARRLRDGVRDRFGVTLEPEPILVGCALDR